jgi:hypothetical protein
MKKCNIFLCCLLVTLTLFGQTPPRWINDAWRESSYPKNVYYAAFLSEDATSRETPAQAQARMEIAVKRKVSENIRVQVRSQQIMKEEDYGTVESSSAYNREEIQTSSDAEIIGLKVESYYDGAKKQIYAFAYVNKAELADYYHKQINLDLSKVDMALGISEQLIASGKKISASKKCSEVKEVFNDVLYCQEILIAIGADKDVLQAGRSENLQRQVNQLLLNLEQSTFIYVDCQFEQKGGAHDVFVSDPGILCDMVKGAISENDCSVTDNKEEADYELTLIASTTQRSSGSGQFGIISYYANVRGNLYNRLTRKKTIDFSILNDPDAYATGATPEAAATKAFKLPKLKDKLLDKILAKIKY